MGKDNRKKSKETNDISTNRTILLTNNFGTNSKETESKIKSSPDKEISENKNQINNKTDTPDQKSDKKNNESDYNTKMNNSVNDKEKSSESKETLKTSDNKGSEKNKAKTSSRKSLGQVDREKRLASDTIDYEPVFK